MLHLSLQRLYCNIHGNANNTNTISSLFFCGNHNIFTTFRALLACNSPIYPRSSTCSPFIAPAYFVWSPPSYLLLMLFVDSHAASGRGYTSYTDLCMLNMSRRSFILFTPKDTAKTTAIHYYNVRAQVSDRGVERNLTMQWTTNNTVTWRLERTPTFSFFTNVCWLRWTMEVLTSLLEESWPHVL